MTEQKKKSKPKPTAKSWLKKNASRQAAIVKGDNNIEPKPERIAKRMARAGLCSRREAENWITSGRVTVNGKLLDSPACVVNMEDRIEVDGQLLPGRERTRLWLYHKPTGVLSTNRDPEGRPTLFEQLPKDMPRLVSVGRLDMNTEGLLLMTNDGGLARVLELPSTGWLRKYRVRAHGKIDPEKLKELKNGIAVDGILYGSIDAEVEREQGHNTWLVVSIREGKNREVKNVLAAVGLTVNRLIRVSYGPFQLGDLSTREIIEIRGRTLREQLGTRLISESGADFDAPILNQQLSSQKPKTVSKINKKAKKKISRGEMAEGTMQRLSTQKNGPMEKRAGKNQNRKSRRNSGWKQN